MSIPETLQSIQNWKELRKRLNGTLGFVPTMGALHSGHLSLIKKSVAENDHTLVSIFINPTQFNDTKDLKDYPVQIDQDLQAAQLAGADFILFPQYQEIYADRYRFQLNESETSKILCGATRPGHFKGVLTVVMKLLQIAQADRAYFGEKDYQQFLLIQEMAEAFFLNTEIVPCPIVRETDGLAMSSRNQRLTPDGRKAAPQFARILQNAANVAQAKQDLRAAGFKVDYVEETYGRRFGAVFLDDVRLIDNFQL